jgi:hypothetical protein
MEILDALPRDKEAERLLLSALMVATPEVRQRGVKGTPTTWFVDDMMVLLLNLMRAAGDMDGMAFCSYVSYHLRNRDPGWLVWLTKLLVGKSLGPAHVPVRAWIETRYAVSEPPGAGDPMKIPEYQRRLARVMGLRRDLESLERRYEQLIESNRTLFYG